MSADESDSILTPKIVLLCLVGLATLSASLIPWFAANCLASSKIDFDGCDFETPRDIICDVSNNVTRTQCRKLGTGESFIDKILHPVFPPWARWIGYGVAAGIYLLCVFMCLFITAAFDEKTANDWIWRCAISVCVNIIFMRPLIVSIQHFIEGVGTVSTISVDLDLGFATSYGAS